MRIALTTSPLVTPWHPRHPTDLPPRIPGGIDSGQALGKTPAPVGVAGQQGKNRKVRCVRRLCRPHCPGLSSPLFPGHQAHARQPVQAGQSPNCTGMEAPKPSLFSRRSFPPRDELNPVSVCPSVLFLFASVFRSTPQTLTNSRRFDHNHLWSRWDFKSPLPNLHGDPVCVGNQRRPRGYPDY